MIAASWGGGDKRIIRIIQDLSKKYFTYDLSDMRVKMRNSRMPLQGILEVISKIIHTVLLCMASTCSRLCSCESMVPHYRAIF